MSRIGKKPIPLSENVKVTIEGSRVIVEGPKGTLSLTIPLGLKISQREEILLVERKEQSSEGGAIYGVTRQLLANMVRGVAEEWTKKLQVLGTGYLVQPKDGGLSLSLGLSHQVDFPAPEGIHFEVEGDVLTVIGADRQEVGRIARQIRSLRPPDAYKGKGIRYFGEEIKLKAGKAAKVGEGGAK